MILSFSRKYLSGEGDVIRHLSYTGYVVTHVQVKIIVNLSICDIRHIIDYIMLSRLNWMSLSIVWRTWLLILEMDLE